MANQALLDEATRQLQAAGAEGIWLVRGAAGAMLAYSAPDEEGELRHMPALVLARPHETILIARFPAGDGRADGIEFMG